MRKSVFSRIKYILYWLLGIPGQILRSALAMLAFKSGGGRKSHSGVVSRCKYALSRMFGFVVRIFRFFYRRTMWIVGFVWRFIWRELWTNIDVVIGYSFVGVLGIALTLFMLWPSYKDPNSRMYTSGMGYGAMKRKMGLPFEVSGARCKREQVIIPYLGEGLINGAPVRLAMIPMAMCKKVYVQEGDYVQKGQLLLELDDLEAQRKLESAQLALKTAQAELKRVEVGSAYVLAQERPEHDRIKVNDAKKQVELLQQKLDAQREMLQRGLVAKTALMDSERILQEAKSTLQEAEFFAGLSTKGIPYSLEIAKNALVDAKAAVGFREAQLGNYKLYAPEEGLISAVLIKQGEFNSDAGKPAFLLTTGLWFEGYFDQAVLSRLQVGQESEVFLEAIPGEKFIARVTKIIPEVTFNSGGPEIARPLRPRGTGAPEWAATFKVRFDFDPFQRNGLTKEDLAIGMTGNVKVLTKVNALTVPRNAILSIAAARALVTTPPSDEVNVQTTDWTQKRVKLGYVGHDWAEIAEGLEEGDVVFVKGHRIIREGDVIEMVELGS